MSVGEKAGVKALRVAVLQEEAGVDGTQSGRPGGGGRRGGTQSRPGGGSVVCLLRRPVPEGEAGCPGRRRLTLLHSPLRAGRPMT